MVEMYVRISQVLILALKCHTFTYMCEISYFLSDILNVMQFFLPNGT